jgi:translation elongation factor EF-1alpha
MAGEKLVGKISHYYKNIGVGIIELFEELRVGDKIRIKGSSGDFEQQVDSMQIEHQQVQEAGVGQGVGIKVSEKVREGDEIYKVS